MINDDDAIISNTTEILDEVHQFYGNLYSSVNIYDNCTDSLFNFINCSVLSEDKDMCDAIITVEELQTAITNMAKNKSPGPDGLTVEWHCKFYDCMYDILLHIFQCVKNDNIMSRSMRFGVISLIYKNKGDNRSLKNWRPISLLNVDYKILARILSARLKRVLPKIISVSQTCCVVGRDIADTIVTVRDIIDMAERDNLEGYIVRIDQEKAFDRVSHSYLISILRKFGFGDNFIQWINIFYTEIKSSVKCNGHLTKPFLIKNSVRQGCPISAMLYVLVAEPLGLAIKANPYIKGIPLPLSSNTSKVFQHADDTTLTLADTQSIHQSFNVLDMYCKRSGAKVNKEKTELLSILSGKLSDKYCKFVIKSSYF